jgi:hypothetical protein
LAFFEETFTYVDAASSEAVFVRGTEVRLVGSDAVRQITQGRRQPKRGGSQGDHPDPRRHRDGVIAALHASKPGKPAQSREELSRIAGLEAEVARLQTTVVEQAVELAVLRGKSGWG